MNKKNEQPGINFDNDWTIDKDTIKQYALFLMRMFKENCESLPKNQQLIEEK